MNPSENTQSVENNNSYSMEGMALQPYPRFWYQNPAYNPVFIPAAGPRNGSLYFPYSVVPSEYPGFLVPQSPLPTTLNRRPVFPMCYNPAQCWQRSGYAKQMKTQETQTELQLQHNGISQSSCESRDVPSNPQKGEDPCTYKGEQRAVRSEQCHEVRHDEMLKSELTMEMDKEKTGYGAVPQILPPPDEVEDGDEIHNTLNSDLDPSTGDVSTLCERPLCTSVEAVKDLSLQPGSQKPLGVGERKPDNSRGSHGVPEKVDGEEVGEQNSYPQGASQVSSAAWLAQFEKVDEATQCDMSWWQDAELERCPESSPEGGRKGTEDMSVHCEELDGEEVGEQNSHPQGAVSSAAWLAQSEKVDEATQCDMSWWQDAELERCPEQVPLVNEESSRDYATQGSREKLRNRKLKSGDQAQSVFLNHKTVYLKRNAHLHVVVPDSSSDSDLEEEYEVEWLFEEDSSVSSSKGKFYHEACRASRLPHGRPIVWPSRYMDKDSKYAEYENVPLLWFRKTEDDREIIFSKLQVKHWAKQEASQESLEAEKCQA
ncbi:uncharacterized protein RBU33_011251 isoform 2-T5 [Hipposideros larvatus]